MHVEFRWETSLCCRFCNPVNLADYECDGVRVVGPGVDVSICETCLGVLDDMVTAEVMRVELEPEVVSLLSGDGEVLSNRTCDCSASWMTHVHCPVCNRPLTFGELCPGKCC